MTGTFVTAPVLNVNDAPTGAPLLSTVDVEVGTQLSVDITSIADEDGLPTPLPVQWFADNVSVERAHVGRWRTQFDAQTTEQVDRLYGSIVADLRRQGVPIPLET